MTFAEIIPSLLQGKKIRRSGFGEDYLVFNEDDYLVYVGYSDQLNENFTQTWEIDGQDFRATDWEVVEGNSK